MTRLSNVIILYSPEKYIVYRYRPQDFDGIWDSVTLFHGIKSLLIYNVDGKWLTVRIIVELKDGRRLKAFKEELTYRAEN